MRVLIHALLTVRYAVQRAPEAMTSLKFSTATDIWSFGIVLLEIYIDGALVMNELNNMEVMAQIQSNYAAEKIQKPPTCEENMWELMQSCWHMDPQERPDFKYLSSLLASDEFIDVVEVSVKPDYIPDSAGAGSIVYYDADPQGSEDRAKPERDASIRRDSAAKNDAWESFQQNSLQNDGGLDISTSYVGRGDADAYTFPGQAESASSAVAVVGEHEYVVQGDAAAEARKQQSVGMYAVSNNADDGGTIGGGGVDSGGGGGDGSSAVAVVGEHEYVVQGDAAAEARKQQSIGMYAVSSSADGDDVGGGGETNDAIAYVASGAQSKQIAMYAADGTVDASKTANDFQRRRARASAGAGATGSNSSEPLYRPVYSTDKSKVAAAGGRPIPTTTSQNGLEYNIQSDPAAEAEKKRNASLYTVHGGGGEIAETSLDGDAGNGDGYLEVAGNDAGHNDDEPTAENEEFNGFELSVEENEAEIKSGEKKKKKKKKTNARKCAQNSSTGACENLCIAGSTRCVAHSCSYPDCRSAKSSKLEFCTKHNTSLGGVEL